MSAFLHQRARAYRNFQLVFTLLSLNFLLPATVYILAPHQALHQLDQVNQLLGGGPYSHVEADSHLWRYLGAANVMTLGFMCVLLQVNLRRFFPVLVPLTFMKSLAATLWLAGFFAEPSTPVFLAAAVLDYVTSGAFVFFSVRAHREIASIPDGDLVPRLMLGGA
jgi:hypothetical protein